MLCASGLVCSHSSYAALSFPDLSCSYWNQIQAVLVLIRHLIPFVRALEQSAWIVNLSLATRCQSEKQNISSLLNIAGSPFIFKLFYFLYTYISLFFFCGFLWSPSAHIGRPRRSDWLLKFIVCKLKFLSTRTSKSIGNAQHSAEFQHLSSAQLVSVIVIVRISDWGGRMVGAWHWYGIWWLLCARAAAHHGSLVFIKTAMCHETYFDKTNKNFRAPLTNGEWVLVAE